MISETSIGSSFSIGRIREMMDRCAVAQRYPLLTRALQDHTVIILSDEEDRAHVGQLHRSLKSGGWTEPGTVVRDVVLGIRLWREGRRIRNAVIITHGDCPAGFTLMIIQFLTSLFFRPLPHVIVGCSLPAENGSGQALSLLRKILINGTVYRCVLSRKHEVKTFTGNSGIRSGKIVFLPTYHSLDNFDGEVSEGDYVFSGGPPSRDYGPLIQACKDLGMPVKIATSDPVAGALAGGDTGVEVRRMSNTGFLRWMAGSRLVVIPDGRQLCPDTLVNAMLLGKAVILMNRENALGYLEDGKTGLVVESGDYERLRRELEAVYHFDALRSLLGANALKWVIDHNLCVREWTHRLYELALEGHYRSVSDHPQR